MNLGRETSFSVIKWIIVLLDTKKQEVYLMRRYQAFPKRYPFIIILFTWLLLTSRRLEVYKKCTPKKAA
jgi:hypothetical protein